jgi:hypothetical protein
MEARRLYQAGSMMIMSYTVLDCSRGKTHWRCSFCKERISGRGRVAALGSSHFLGKLCMGKGGDGMGQCAGGGIFMHTEFKRAKEVLGKWQRTRNEVKQAKKEDTKKTVEALREGGGCGGGTAQARKYCIQYLVVVQDEKEDSPDNSLNVVTLFKPACVIAQCFAT